MQVSDKRGPIVIKSGVSGDAYQIRARNKARRRFFLTFKLGKQPDLLQKFTPNARREVISMSRISAREN